MKERINIKTEAKAISIKSLRALEVFILGKAYFFLFKSVFSDFLLVFQYKLNKILVVKVNRRGRNVCGNMQITGVQCS